MLLNIEGNVIILIDGVLTSESLLQQQDGIFKLIAEKS
jgi:hypothetical protein